MFLTRATVTTHATVIAQTSARIVIQVLKGVLNNFSHFGSARLFLFIFAYYIKHLLIYDIW